MSAISHMHIQYERFQQVCVQRSKLATFFSSVAARAAILGLRLNGIDDGRRYPLGIAIDWRRRRVVG
jgi:hypothetical protein